MKERRKREAYRYAYNGVSEWEAVEALERVGTGALYGGRLTRVLTEGITDEKNVTSRR